jgi:protein-L-isoaspartate(D-aspartate) O-methyltransferase
MLAIAPTFDGRRTIPSPECRALIRQMLNLGPQDKVLEIGTGSGTQTNEFAATGAEVHSIELEPWVDTTQIIGDCVYLHTGDGINGLPNHGPFTAIVATCGVEQIPKAWEEQLCDGGRMVVPLGSADSQRLCILQKRGRELSPVRVAAYVRFSMMKERPSLKPPKYQPYDATP